ncbi:FAD-dependent oxidoreductase [Spirillospora sp. NBC_00431]
MNVHDESEISADVVVIGAGLSGLAAAHRLAGAGVEPVVLEGGTRVGGRTWNVPLAPGKVTEAGAMYVCDGQDEILGLAAELGVELFRSFEEGRSVAVLDGERHEYEGGMPPLPGEALRELNAGLRSMDLLVGKLATSAPWAHPDAARLDRLSLADWRDETLRSPLARNLFDCSVTTWFAVPPSRISFLYALHAVATCGGGVPLLRAQTGIRRFRDGSQALPEAMAAKLAGLIHLEAPVREIDQSAGDKVVVQAPGLRVVARRAVVAVGAVGAPRMRPAPPDAWRVLAESWQRGPLFKTNVVYDEPFWRDEGLSGSGFTDLGPAPGFLDASPPDGSPGVLAVPAFALPETEFRGNSAAFLDDPAIRRESTLRALARCLGPRALRPARYLETDWRREPYISGCQGGLPPGALTAAGEASRRPVGLVHWAGTETAERWTGWMNGAVQAGERCAREILAGL